MIKTDVKPNEGLKLSDYMYTGANRVAGFGTDRNTHDRRFKRLTGRFQAVSASFVGPA